MPSPPTGTVTFLFTDIEGSTTLWERHPNVMKVALARHDSVMRDVIGHHSGFVFKTVGDAFCAAFPTASDALAAVTAAQRILQAEDWKETPIKVRMGLHTGTAEEHDGDYFGPTVNRVARIMSVAYGEQILLSTATAELVRDQIPRGLILREMGEHRLKGLINPERLWQVVAPGLRQDFPALQSLNAIPNNLPLRTTSFLGRDQDVTSVRELLETTNLLTLVGAGGIGKTSLSLQVAAAVLDKYKDGAWFVELAPISDAGLVQIAVADALGLREEPGRPLITTILDFLRTRRMLIVLDNCEHVIEACASFAAAVLRACRDTRILASSREPLAVNGELTWSVPSLPTPDPKAHATVQQLNTFAAVRLFVERAKFAHASFAVTDENAPAVVHICWQLDGIPLAIELAASRVKAMRVEQIAERLSDRFRLLTGGSRTALPRHQTLRSTIDWSHSLLPDAERILLRRLSVFAGGWTMEAAEAVCAGNGIESLEVFDALTRLVGKSLVVLDEGAAESRYKMFETIKQYGHEKLLEANDIELVSDQHLQHFMSVAESLEPHFFHPDQISWYAKADIELDNMRAALEWSVATKKIEFGLRLVAALHRYWVARVYWMEANGWFGRLLAICDPGNPSPLHAKALFVCGHITYYYDPAAGQRFGEESLRMARSLDYKQGIVNALWLLGWAYTPKLDESADPFFAESIKLAREIDYAWGAMHAYAWCGVYKICIGNYEAAKPLFQASKVEAKKLGGDAALLGRCDGNLGLIALLEDDFPTAKSYLDQSLALQKGANNKNGIAESLWLQGRLSLRQGDHQQAVKHFRESLRLYQIYPNSLWVTRGLAYLAITYVAHGEYSRAAKVVGALSEKTEISPSLKAQLGSLAAISEYEGALIQLKSKIAKADYVTAVDAGQEMTREQAITFMLEEYQQ
jgi:predicted ATPase/class 3 adenylate cyclase